MAVHQPSRLNREEQIGVVVAIALHAGLVAWLALAPSRSTFQPPPERMTVSLSEEVAPEATSPEPLAQAAPETAPTLGEAAAAPASEPLPEVVPPEPAPRVVASPLPRPSPPLARPTARASAKPAAKLPAKATATTDTRTRRRPDAPAGASRVGSDFLKGIPGGEPRGAAQNPPAARAGPQVVSSLGQALMRQIRPKWQGRVPQGVNAEKIVTILSIELKPDGSLAGTPTFVGQEGVDETNRAQAPRHREEAIRAVQLAAPFDLPPQWYSVWKTLPPLRFKKSISQ